MLGIVPDVTRSMTISAEAGDHILLVGAEVSQDASSLAGSEYQSILFGEVAGAPAIDLVFEHRVHEFVLKLHSEGFLKEAHDLSDGGLAIALIEMCMSSRLGFRSESCPIDGRLDASYFGEAPSRFLIASIDPSRVIELANQAEIPVTLLGQVSDDTQFNFCDIQIDIQDAYTVWDSGLSNILDR